MATKNEAAEQGKKNAELVVNNAFIDGLSMQLQEKTKYGLSFPADYNPTNALMGAYLIMKETTDKNGKCILESCSQASIANSLMDMATLGLNASKKQGYFIAYGGKCQFQKSYFGNITLARRNGLKTINAEIIYDGDTFKYHIENGMKVIDVHEQDFMNIDNDKILGAYAVAVMDDGRKVVEVMNINQLSNRIIHFKTSKNRGYATCIDCGMRTRGCGNYENKDDLKWRERATILWNHRRPMCHTM